MNFKKKIDFCIIPSPYSGGLKNLIFVTYHGIDKVDEKLYYDEDYELVRNLLHDCGFHEIDYCAFQSVSDAVVKREELAYRLINSGLRYSKPFEFNIMGELDTFNKEINPQLDEQKKEDKLLPVLFEPKKSVLNFPVTQFKVPALGEKVPLSFYLFVQCHFVTENDCILELVGDLYSKENNNTRNHLQICTSDFVRLESKFPEVILLQSTKTYSDLLSETNFLHKGVFRYIKTYTNSQGERENKIKDYTYSIMEIKKNINPTHKIVVEVNVAQYWDDMIKMSKQIKKEYNSDSKKIISAESLRPDIIQLKQKINSRMILLAEGEEFEKASTLKKDLNFIEKKLEIIDNLEEKNITKKEISKLFCLR